MRRLPVRAPFVSACFLLIGVGLVGCNPTLNWREVRVKDSPLTALLPCKAEASSRKVQLGGQEVEIQLSSCSAGEATFAVALAGLAEGASATQLATAQNHWQMATLAHISVPSDPAPANTAITRTALRVAGLTDMQTLVAASGKRPTGGRLQFNGLWFHKGSQLFHAAVYAEKINQDLSEPFFSGLKIK